MTALEPYTGATGLSGDDVLIRFLEEGATLAMAERATGIPATLLAALPLSRPPNPPTQEELGEAAAKLAKKAIDTLMDDLERGGPAVRLRAATVVVGHPLRRMQTDESQTKTELVGMLNAVLQGRMPEEALVIEEDV